MKERIYLAGTTNGSKWREELIKLLDSDKLSWFDPTDSKKPAKKLIQEDIIERVTCDKILYVLTPKMGTNQDVKDVIDDSKRIPSKIILYVMNVDGSRRFTTKELGTMKRLMDVVSGNKATVVRGSLQDLANHLNTK